MTNSQRLATVRDGLTRWILDSNESGAKEPIIRESILIRDEFYVGRRFYTESHRAVWFIEQDELKIYNSVQELLSVLRGDEIDQVARDAELRPADAGDHHEADVIKMPLREDRHGDVGDETRRAA